MAPCFSLAVHQSFIRPRACVRWTSSRRPRHGELFRVPGWSNSVRALYDRATALCLTGRDSSCGRKAAVRCTLNSAVEELTNASHADALRRAVAAAEPLKSLHTFRVAVAEKDFRSSVDVILCNQLLRLLCDANYIEEAMYVYQKMRLVGGRIAPSVVTYSTLISRIAPRGKKRKRPSGREITSRDHDDGSNGTFLKLKTEETVWRLFENMLADVLRPDVVIFNSMMSAAAAVGSARLAWRAFRAMKQCSVRPSVRTLNQMLVAVSSDHSRTMADVHAIVDEMRRRDLTPDVFTYTTLCDIAADHGDVRMVFKLVNEMEKNGTRPNARTWSNVVRACCSGGEIDRGREVLNNLLENDARNVSVHLYTVLVDAYGKAGNLPVAFELLSEMTEKGFGPNAHTYSTLIHSCGRAGATDLMMSVFAAMQRANVRPNEVTYSSIIYYAGRAGLDIRSADSLDEISRKSLMSQEVRSSPTSEIAKTLERGGFSSRTPVARTREEASILSSRTVPAATSVQKLTEKLNPKPEVVVPAGSRDTSDSRSEGDGRGWRQLTFRGDVSRRAIGTQVGASATDNVTHDGSAAPREAELLELLSGFASKNELFQSFLILGEMKRAGFDVRKAYNGVLGVCGRASDFEAAVSAFEGMRSDGVAPDLSSYTNLIRALGGNGESGVQKQRRLVRVFLVFMEMQSAGVTPDLIFMNGLIEACRRCGAPDKAREVFLSISQLGLVADAASYSSWLLACVECGDLKQALKVVETMRASNARVSTGAWATLFSYLGRIGKHETGIGLLCAGDTVGLGALLKGLCQHGDVTKVDRMVREVDRRSWALPASTHRFLRTWRARAQQ